MGILDYIEPSEVILDASGKMDNFLEPAVIRPDVYSHAWLFMSDGTSDEDAVEKLKHLQSRLYCILSYDFEINYLKYDSDYQKSFGTLNAAYRSEEWPFTERHTHWVLQFNLRHNMTAANVFRVIMSMIDWMNDIHNLRYTETCLYESDGKIFGKLLDISQSFMRGAGAAKRGTHPTRVYKESTIEYLMAITGKSDYFYRRDYPFKEEYEKLWEHYMKTRHNIQNIFAGINVEEVTKSFKMVTDASSLFTLAATKIGPNILKPIKNAFDFRSTYNK